MSGNPQAPLAQQTAWAKALAGARARFAAEPHVLLPLCGATSIGYLPALTMPWLISLLSGGLGHTESAAGTIVTVQLSLLALSTIALGSQVQRVNRRGLAVLGAAAMVACGAAFMTHAPAAIVMVLLAVAGVGCGFANAAGASLVSQSADPVRLTSNLWIWTVAWQTLVWFVTPLAVAQWGGIGLGAVYAFGGLAMIPWLLRTPIQKSAAAEAETVTGNGSGPQSLPKLARESSSMPAVLIPLLLCVAAFWLRDSIIWSLAEKRGTLLSVSASQLSQTLTIASIFGVLGPIAANYLGTRWGRGPTLLLALVLVAIVMQIIAVAHTAEAYRFGFLLWTATSLFTWTYLTALAAAVDAEGRVVAICSGVVFAAAAFGPLLGGMLSTLDDARTFPAFIAALSVITVAAVLVVLRNHQADDPT